MSPFGDRMSSALDLIVVDDCSTDESLEVAAAWVRRNENRFNRAAVVRTEPNAGLGPVRNLGFAMAETQYVMPLDADNRLRPSCVLSCLQAIRYSGASFVYPEIRAIWRVQPPARRGPLMIQRDSSAEIYVDAMALVAKSAWAAVGGFPDARLGWEDYEFWCRLVERGHWGHKLGEELAEVPCSWGVYVAAISQRRQKTNVVLQSVFKKNHPWLTVADVLAREQMASKLRHRE